MPIILAGTPAEYCFRRSVAAGLLWLALVPVGAQATTFRVTCEMRFPDLSRAEISTLVKLAGSHDVFQGRCAVEALRQFDAAAVPSLIALLRSPNVRARRAAAAELSHYSRTSPTVTDPLADALDDPDKEVRYHAASALEMSRHRSPRVTNKLIEKMSDPSPAVISASAYALASAGPLPARALEPLTDALAVVDRFYQKWHVIDAISNVQSDRVLPVLINLIVGPDDQIRSRAAGAASEFGAAALPLLLKEEAKAVDPEVRAAIASATRRAKEFVDHPILLELERIDGNEIDRQMLFGSDRERVSAVRTIEHLARGFQLRGGSDAVLLHRLSRLAEKDKSPAVRRAAKLAIRAFRPVLPPPVSDVLRGNTSADR